MPPSGQDLYTLEWVRYAIRDLRSARCLAECSTDLNLAGNVYWMAQQAAEKAIKSLLFHHAIDFNWTHNLEALRLKLPETSPMRHANLDLQALTKQGMEWRYPDDLPDEPSPEEAVEALTVATTVVELMSSELRDLLSEAGLGL